MNTVPTGEYDGSHDVYTWNDGKSGETDDTIIGPGNPYTVSNVIQSRSTESATTFAAGLPLSTIYIDQSKITGQTNAEKADFYVFAGPYSSAITRDSGGLVKYNAVSGPKQIMGGQVNTLEGNLFYVQFADAAILPDGSTANLRITYSNARIVVDQRYDAGTKNGISWNAQAYNGNIHLARGSQISYGGDDPTNMKEDLQYATQKAAVVQDTAQQYDSRQTFDAGTKKQPMVGMSIDVTYQIVDDNGTLVPGTFLFAICGVNLTENPTGESTPVTILTSHSGM